MSTTSTTSLAFGRRLLQVPNATLSDGTQEITNPIMCLDIGEMIVFRLWVNQEDRTLSHYPKYAKVRIDRFNNFLGIIYMCEIYN